MPTKRVACEKRCPRLSCYRPQTTPHGWQEKQSKPWCGHSGLLQHGQRRWKCRRGCRRYVTSAIRAVYAWTTAFAPWRRYSQHFGWVVSILFKQIFMSGSVGGPARELAAPGPLFDKEIRRSGGVWGISAPLPAWLLCLVSRAGSAEWHQMLVFVVVLHSLLCVFVVKLAPPLHAGSFSLVQRLDWDFTVSD